MCSDRLNIIENGDRILLRRDGVLQASLSSHGGVIMSMIVSVFIHDEYDCYCVY